MGARPLRGCLVHAHRSSIGGSIAYDDGFNVEPAGDSPVWHPSEVDVFAGGKRAASDADAGDAVDGTSTDEQAPGAGGRRPPA